MGCFLTPSTCMGYRSIRIALLFLTVLKSGYAQEYPLAGRRVHDAEFWTKVQPLGAIRYMGMPSEEIVHREYYRYYLYRDGKSGWYLTGEGNGQVWKLDSNLTWQRLDKTFYMGYDFGSYLIKPGLKYGGYGYWRTHGTLRVFNVRSGEWEIRPLSRELPTMGNYCYYNDEKEVMLQSGSIDIQTAIKKEYSAKDSLFELEYKNKEWKTLGALNPAASYFLSPWYSLNAEDAPSGRLMFTSSGDTCALVDFIHLTCTIPNPQRQKAFRDFYNRKKAGHLLVSTNSALLTVDTADFSIVDSLSWDVLLQKPAVVLPVLKPTSIPAIFFEGKFTYWLGAVAVLMGGGGWLFIRNRNRRKTAAGAVINPSTVRSSGALPERVEADAKQGFLLIQDKEVIHINGRPVRDNLNESQMLLLRVLVAKKKAGQLLSTNELNELLGIDTRSPDNQKKIRSEVVKGLNLAFHALGFPHEAIGRVRHNDDRRMMMYFLHDDLMV